VRNWREYDRSLIARGDLTVWLSPDLAWHAPAGTGKRGRPPVFSDTAIQCALTLKVLFQLPLRAAQGLAGSPIRLAGLGWSVPHFSTLSRRQQALTVVIPYRARGEPLHLVVDSSGLKVLGEGEWKLRRDGADRRRIWRKVHLAVDADSHEIRAVEMTDYRHGDGEILPDLLAQVPQGEGIASVGGDGAYDTRTAYAAAAARNADLLVPPRRNGKPWKTPTRGACERNETLRASLLHRSLAWVAFGRVRPGPVPSTRQGHPSCRSRRMPLGGITSRSRSTGSPTGPSTTRAFAPAAA
jgi:hypothetical protein